MTWLRAVALLAFWLPAVASAADVIVIKGRMSNLSELPPEMADIAKGVQYKNPERFDAYLSSLPDLVLDSTIFYVDEASGSRAGGNASISARRITLLNGARIITNGYRLTLNAQYLEVGDGVKIVSFFGNRRLFPLRAEGGQSGRSGRDGGTVLLNVLKELSAAQSLTIDLQGEDGQWGSPGIPGLPGAPGASGQPSFVPSGTFVECIKSGTDGSIGGQGGPGGPGGNGGDGGDGGYLILRGGAASTRLSIEFRAEGGRGGLPGEGGPGGPGGPGGIGGQGHYGCGGGRSGPPGPDGTVGPGGMMGLDGKPGYIRADF